ncbi:MAG: SDR family NAD(P)-dependent oxidoreductase [Lachnospiraceae bacterium]|nr:SDR family NAD(P)-dependent oxidoreductase [Lachnospiraceae bacterium]
MTFLSKQRDLRRLTLKTALVTGASRGIGREIAKVLAFNGYNLHLVCEKNVKMLQDLKEEIEKEVKVTIKNYAADVSNYEDLSKIFDGTDELDVVVNNAGISYVGLLTDMTPEEWQRIISVNLNSVFYTSKLAVPKMLKKHAGSIINISSVWGNVGASTEVAYSASKAGVNGLTRALAKELAPSNIAVNAIACGFIDTDMNAHLSSEEKEALKDFIPANRFGTPSDVAAAVMGVLRTTSYMTGQIITVDGAWI